MAICALTYFCSDEPTFWIDHQTGYAVDKLTADYTIGIGAEKVAYDSPDKIGSVKIRKTAYRKCLLKVDTAVLLAQPSIVSLLHQHQANMING
ncbi:hypothetical protein HB763_11300 [Vibrio campbellii]|nr:hypothetical protein HB763_11300 [Vibrio campbellii]